MTVPSKNEKEREKVSEKFHLKLTHIPVVCAVCT